MKILTAKQQQDLDQFTIDSNSITSLELMERAGRFCFDRLQLVVDKKQPVIVFCGPGNNGGDGLVIARLLANEGYNVNCLVVQLTEQTSGEFDKNLVRLKKTKCTLQTIQDINEIDTTALDGAVVVDALFGVGLNRKVEGLAKECIELIQSAQIKSCVAIDIPSGLFGDQKNNASDVMVHADFTYTFHAPKISFFLPEFGNCVGNVEVIDIGLDKERANSYSENNFYLSPKKVATLLQKRPTFTHKGTYGHANIIAGSKGKIGAAILTAESALKAGAGLVTATIPSIGVDAMHAALPNVMCDGSQGVHSLGGTLPVTNAYQYGVGPGIGCTSATAKFLYHFLEHIWDPVVLDADALNIIAKNPTLLKEIPEESILTPHPKEFQRLVGVQKNGSERLEIQREFAQKYKVYLILKDARTVIATPEGNCYFSLNGTPGMATGGSGDVLTGILTGLLAQKYSSFDVVRLGVILHGMAGELAAIDKSVYAMTSSDIIDNIGSAYKELLGFAQ